MTINDTHCHLFSPSFFAALGRQTKRVPVPTGREICDELGWEDPVDLTMLADRWVGELDARGVTRAALIASIPGDEESVATAVARHPSRIVGFFMVDASAPDAISRTTRATTELGLRCVCLFPAMHGVPITAPHTRAVIEAAARTPGTAVFVHCGELSVGVRKKLGLPSPFNQALGNPAHVAALAAARPDVPFVIPHFGAGRFDEALDAARKCPNIYLDTSSSNSWIQREPGRTLEQVFARALDVLGPARLLFGTDSSFFPRGWQSAIHDAQKAALDRIGVSDGDQALIFGGNFDRVFPRP